MADVRATLTENFTASDAPPGSFAYYGDSSTNPDGMIYRCPCGCRQLGSLPFRPAPSPSWEWDGNREAPTLSPSVHHILNLSAGGTKTHWHGWLQAGVWRSC